MNLVGQSVTLQHPSRRRGPAWCAALCLACPRRSDRLTALRTAANDGASPAAATTRLLEAQGGGAAASARRQLLHHVAGAEWSDHWLWRLDSHNSPALVSAVAAPCARTFEAVAVAAAMPAGTATATTVTVALRAFDHGLGDKVGGHGEVCLGTLRAQRGWVGLEGQRERPRHSGPLTAGWATKSVDTARSTSAPLGCSGGGSATSANASSSSCSKRPGGAQLHPRGACPGRATTTRRESSRRRPWPSSQPSSSATSSRPASAPGPAPADRAAAVAAAAAQAQAQAATQAAAAATQEAHKARVAAMPAKIPAATMRHRNASVWGHAATVSSDLPKLPLPWKDVLPVGRDASIKRVAVNTADKTPKLRWPVFEGRTAVVAARHSKCGACSHPWSLAPSS